MKSYNEKNRHNRFLLAALLIFIGAVVLLGLNDGFIGIEAALTDNLSGFAWSETIGWISMNSTNQQGTGASYGVKADSAGNLSGYAWSETIGWVSFNAAHMSGCSSAPCPPTFNKTTGAVSGWARACAGTASGDCLGAPRTDGWDGWIHLAGTAQNGAPYGVVADGCAWGGYAWGSDVVGWIHFSGTAQNGASYGVIGTVDACGVFVPTVTTLPADNIQTYAARLKASANPNGLPTTGWFRYYTINPGSCDDAFGTRTPTSGDDSLGGGTIDVPYLEPLGSPISLTPGTTYYYCAIAESSAGKGFGNVLSFTTASAQCDDNADNDGDNKTDENDPACHTDYNAGNSASYNPTLNTETVPPASLTFGASPKFLPSGEQAIITWSALNVKSCTVTEDNPAFTDTWTSTAVNFVVSPVQQTSSFIYIMTTYTLTCTNLDDQVVSATVLIRMRPVVEER